MSTTENNYEQHSRELGKIGMWLEDFAATDDDTTYLLFLRLLADYRHQQAQVMDNAVEIEERRALKL
jgi:hypothetical protein